MTFCAFILPLSEAKLEIFDSQPAEALMSLPVFWMLIDIRRITVYSLHPGVSQCPLPSCGWDYLELNKEIRISFNRNKKNKSYNIFGDLENYIKSILYDVHIIISISLIR